MRVCDKFGPKVGLNYKGNRSYKTSIGGVITILFYMGILGWGAFKFSELFTDNSYTLDTQR